MSDLAQHWIHLVAMGAGYFFVGFGIVYAALRSIGWIALAAWMLAGRHIRMVRTILYAGIAINHVDNKRERTAKEWYELMRERESDVG